MFVPDPVLSLKIKPTKKEFNQKFQKAINKFKREDPTFHINQDKESEEIIMSVYLYLYRAWENSTCRSTQNGCAGSLESKSKWANPPLTTARPSPTGPISNTCTRNSRVAQDSSQK